ncbi:retinol dehydrogenase 14 [Arthrobacter sp. Hiyo4]|nr:retinol dehydrogenase 14 [Arthrobacter sp. Hiyo4]
MASLDGTVALVTGAAGGLGGAVASGLAREGALAVVVGRSTTRASEAMAGIRWLVPGANLEPLVCDLSDQSSIHAAADFLSGHDRLDVLVNAAGVFRKERQVTRDGIELTFATNVMAYFLLTSLLLDALTHHAAAPPSNSRIVNIVSRYGNARLNFDDLQTASGKYSYLRSTPPTMLARVLLTQEFAERLHGTGVVANAVHPGLVKNTTLLQDVGGPFRWITNTFGAPAEKAADTPLWLATSGETAGVSGKLWAKRKELPTPGMGSDPKLGSACGTRARNWPGCRDGGNVKDEDLRARLKELHLPPVTGFFLVDVPEMRFVMVDWRGGPDRPGFSGAIHEGLCAQIMHVGPNSGEVPTLARLHSKFLPAHDLVPNGNHHEIYLDDPK